jgi:hypothetical protein
MKIFFQKLFVNFGLAILVINAFGILTSGEWAFTAYIIQLFFVILIIRLLILLTNKFQSRYPVLEYLLELGMVLAVVLGFGWLFGWYDIGYLWYMVATIVTVYAAVYAVGIGRTRRDVAFINEQIKKRKKKEGENHE